ncbi:hypothetical protein [Thermophagus xiamenensis]|uniref:DUF2281 domain-containing protein n=1 Tax=Thermophagus xiamenensis TaxID=385682 RepID=A0A1I2DNB0_9BACT|nr:hypothetical protein [Thermophagus xiamenensis]SFE81390.1 hypothetical protein SAMN05444380_11945 [Thermophagus xiamenensis]
MKAYMTAKNKKLSLTAQRTVSDFIDFLLYKEKEEKSKRASNYKKRILEVSQWAEADCKIFEENRKLFNQWPPPKW